jgi:hypothetical protein
MRCGFFRGLPTYLTSRSFNFAMFEIKKYVMLNCNRLVFNYSIDLIIDEVPVKCETKSKRNETKRNRSKRNASKRNEIYRNETKSKRNEINRNEIDRNETKRNNTK